MKLHIQTQIQENYGAHDWDGQGECPQYWKFKGGNDYMVLDITDDDQAQLALPALREQIEHDDYYYREYIIDQGLVADDYVTEVERAQLEYEGRIVYPAIILTLETA